MEVKKSTVTKLSFRRSASCDLISVYVNDFRAGWGKVIIDCGGDAWVVTLCNSVTTISKFFRSCSNEHIISQMEPKLRHEIIDHARLVLLVRARVIELRSDRVIDHESARGMFDVDDWGCYESGFNYEPIECPECIDPDDFYCVFSGIDVPMMKSYRYQYLESIVDAAKVALKTCDKQKNK